jgi:hypothetical protein
VLQLQSLLLLLLLLLLLQLLSKIFLFVQLPLQGGNLLLPRLHLRLPITCQCADLLFYTL